MHLNNKLVIRVLVAAFVALGLFVRNINADARSDQELKAFREGKRVDLPPFMVTEENPQKGTKPWTYLSVPGLEVISKCSDSTTLWFVGQFTQRLAELEEILPSRLQFERTAPITLILIPPEMGDKMGKEIVKAVGDSESSERSSRVTSNGRVSSLYGMVPQVSLTDSESTTMMVELNDGDRRGISLTIGYVLNMLERRIPTLPYWFQSTVFSLYQQIRWSDEEALTIPSVYWPRINVPVTAGTPNPQGYKVFKDDDGKLYRVEPASLIPMGSFLTGPFGEAQQGSQYQLDLWHYEGSLFLYWVFVDETHARRKALWDFVDKSSREPATEALFRQCFGMGFADVTKELSDYLPQAMENPLNLLKVDSVVIPELHLSDADPVTRARIQGNFIVKEMGYMAKSSVLSPYIPLYGARAEAILLKPYSDGSRDPALMSVIGLYYVEAGKDETARLFLQEAASAHVLRPIVYAELARIRKKVLGQSTSKGLTSNDE